MRVASARSVHVSRTRAWPFQAGTQVRRSRRPPSVHWGHDKSLSLGDRDRNRVSLQPDRAQPDREQPDRGNRLIGVRGISVPGFRLALADAIRDRDLRRVHPWGEGLLACELTIGSIALCPTSFGGD